MKYEILDLIDQTLRELSNIEQRNLLEELSSEIYSRIEDVDDTDEFDG